MALTVLTDTQMSAVEYVLRKSKEASEKVYPQLLKKVIRLGFTEKDLERWDILFSMFTVTRIVRIIAHGRCKQKWTLLTWSVRCSLHVTSLPWPQHHFRPSMTVHLYLLSLLYTSAHYTYVQIRTLQWIRQDAPIIIHVNLNHVLQFLVKDTHYRNLFEIHTRRESTALSERKSWEVTFKLVIKLGDHNWLCCWRLYWFSVSRNWMNCVCFVRTGSSMKCTNTVHQLTGWSMEYSILVMHLCIVCDLKHSAPYLILIVYQCVQCWSTVGDPRGVRCCYSYGDSFLQVLIIDMCKLWLLLFLTHYYCIWVLHILKSLYIFILTLLSWRKSGSAPHLPQQTPHLFQSSSPAASTMVMCWMSTQSLSWKL